MHGPRVIGDQEFAAKQAVVKARRNHFGPRVADALPNDAESPSADTAPHSLSVEAIEKVLRENGAHFDNLLDAELMRAGGPRVEALYLFRTLEHEGVAGGPRIDTIADIDEALTALGVEVEDGEVGEAAEGEEADEGEPETETSQVDAAGEPVLRVKDDSAPVLSKPQKPKGKK